MRKLIFVRHSISRIEPEIPPQKWGLTDEGIKRCDNLARKLSVHNPEIIITSIELKAQQTGNIIAKYLGLPVEFGKNIHEHHREPGGIVSNQAFKKRISKMFSQPDELVFGLETAKGALDRFSNAVEMIMNTNPEMTPAIVTHGTVMSLYFSEITGDDPFRFWEKLGLPAFYTVLWPDRVLESTMMQIN
jgi:broad specificity phosphatase PhoE